MHAQRVLARARAVAQAGAAVVAGAGRDLSQAVGHQWPPGRQKGTGAQGPQSGPCRATGAANEVSVGATCGDATYNEDATVALEVIEMNAPHDLLPRVERRPVPAAMLEALRARFGDRCSTAAAVREQHGRGESVYDAAPPEMVVFCEGTEEVAFVVSQAAAHARAGDCLRRRLIARRPPAGGARRRQHRSVTHEPHRAHQRRGLDGDRRGRCDARAVEPRDQGHGPVLPDRPRRQRHARRHGGHARLAARTRCATAR